MRLNNRSFVFGKNYFQQKTMYPLLFWLKLLLLIQIARADKIECNELAKPVQLVTSETIDALQLSTYTRTAGTVVDVTCVSKENEVIGAKRLKCLPSGKWSAERPVCAPKDDLSKPSNKTAIIIGCVVGGVGVIVIIIVIVVGISAYKRRRRHLSTSFDSTYTSEIPLQDKETPFYGYSNSSTTEKIFKVWTSNRTQKKLIAASSLAELKRKGAEKFKLNGKVRLVLESDGTEIEESEGLWAFSEHVLLLLMEGEQWYPNDDNVSRKILSISQFETQPDSGDGKLHIIIDKSLLDLQQTAERF